MIKLDDDLLDELGLGGLPPEEKKKLLAHIYETLEMRVGMKLAEQMSDAQLSEFEQFINRNDEAGALKWLESNFPNYKDVVADEFKKLKDEIKQVAPQILAAGNQQAAMPQQPYPPAPQPAWPPAGPQQYGPPAGTWGQTPPPGPAATQYYPPHPSAQPPGQQYPPNDNYQQAA